MWAAATCGAAIRAFVDARSPVQGVRGERLHSLAPRECAVVFAVWGHGKLCWRHFWHDETLGHLAQAGSGAGLIRLIAAGLAENGRTQHRQ